MPKFRLQQKEANNFLTPQEMYDDYKNRMIEGIHDYQSKTIDLYMENINERNIVLELPTGTGKTLVGLLIAEFRRKKFDEKVLYLCANNQLVNQTVDQSYKTYGIKAVGFTGSAKNYDPADKISFISGKSIGITNYSSLFNSNPFFKDLDIIIFDDAHSGENYVSSNWTVTIDREEDSELYYTILEKLKDIVEDTIYERLLRDHPSPEDKFWIDKIPNPKLINQYINIKNVIDDYINDNESNIRFSWTNIGDHLFACNFYLSWSEIVIRPYVPPTLTLAPFSNAKQRIYMSATPGKSGELERAFGVPNIKRLPMVKDWENRTIGRKYFMFPSASFDNEAKIIKKITEIADRTLMIVKNKDILEQVKKFLEAHTDVQIFEAKDIESSKNAFINCKNGFVLIANRFDGIDFANDECRMLILFDLPNATHIQEKFLISRMAAITLFEERIKTRIVQALGRCTRSNTDYAAVCIFGDELMNSLISPAKLKRFSPELQAELLFGRDNSINQKNIDEYLELLKIFLLDRNEWDEAEQDILGRRDLIIAQSTKLDESDYAALMASSKYEVKAQYSIWKQDYEKAIEYLDSAIINLEKNSLKGYKGFLYYTAACCAYNLYLNGNKAYKKVFQDYISNAANTTSSIRWFNKLIDTKEETVSTRMEHIIENIERYMLSRIKKSIKSFNSELEEILELLNSNDGKKFEQGHKKLGETLGYRVHKSEESAAPDPIWIINDYFCILSEDKIYKTIEQLIPTKDVKQAMGHVNWFNSNIDLLSMSKDAKSITVFISNSSCIEKSAAIHGESVFYINSTELIKFAEKSFSVLKKIRRSFDDIGNIIWREQVVNEFINNKITPADFISMVSTKRISELV